MIAVARIHFNSVRNRAQCGFHGAYVSHPFRGCSHGGAIEPGADVSDPAFAHFASDGCRLAVEPSVALSVSLKDFGVLSFALSNSAHSLLCPEPNLPSIATGSISA